MKADKTLDTDNFFVSGWVHPGSDSHGTRQRSLQNIVIGLTYRTFDNFYLKTEHTIIVVDMSYTCCGCIASKSGFTSRYIDFIHPRQHCCLNLCEEQVCFVGEGSEQVVFWSGPAVNTGTSIADTPDNPVEDFIQTGFISQSSSGSPAYITSRDFSLQANRLQCVCAGGLTYYNLHALCVLGGWPLSLHTHAICPHAPS